MTSHLNRLIEPLGRRLVGHHQQDRQRQTGLDPHRRSPTPVPSASDSAPPASDVRQFSGAPSAVPPSAELLGDGERVEHRRGRYQNPAAGRIGYRKPEHERLPHVVKFSGGRSTGPLVGTSSHEGLRASSRRVARSFGAPPPPRLCQVYDG